MITSRRSLLTGLGAVVLNAPAIVRAHSIMPIKPEFPGWLVRCWETVHPASWGVPRSWVDMRGLPLQGMPNLIWTWEGFVREMVRPNDCDRHPSLRPRPFDDRPLGSDLAFDVGFDAGSPKWVGCYDDSWTHESGGISR